MFSTSLVLLSAVAVGGLLSQLIVSESRWQKLLLTFSGAFLLSVTVLEIFPRLFSGESDSRLGLFVLLGVGIQILLESVTKGAEHGHFHMHEHHGFPVAVFVGLFIHAFIEGIPIHNDTSHHLLTAIVIHKIPVAVILFGFLQRLTPAVWKQWAFLLLFGLASPLGYVLGGYFNPEILQISLAVAAGIFLHISTVIIFESADGHKLKFQKIAMLLLGFGIAYLTLVWH